VKKKMENSQYIMSTLDEYFEILDRENKKRSQLVAKSLVKYLQKSKQANKFEAMQIAK
jgi:metal-responsive CopG/Arc/MetJ family transcriptional regulator